MRIYLVLTPLLADITVTVFYAAMPKVDIGGAAKHTAVRYAITYVMTAINYLLAMVVAVMAATSAVLVRRRLY